ncbi:MAG: DUF1579 family protein [Solirubrobacteraceae bacterium]|nr:DUF1579 family protein [Solirubrobacteraceae bacterium]
MPELDQRLEALVGSWAGPGRLWFEAGPPAPPASEAPVQGGIARVHRHWVRHEYATTIDEVEHSGTALIGAIAPRALWQVAWVDSFHTAGTGLMISEGPIVPGSTTIDVVGSYLDGGGTAWGWRTSFAPEGDGNLAVRHWNITPDGEEALAVEFAYARA